MTALSVIVPTYKRPILLARCLRALANSRGGISFEVIVVDDGRDARTRDYIAAWRTEFTDIQCIFPPPGARGPAAARNAGALAARGEVLAFTDDDCIPRRTWLAAGYRRIREGADAVTGQLRVPLPMDPRDYEHNERGLENAEFITANCFCRADVFRAIKGFDERFAAAWREDSDLHFRLLTDGYRLAHAEDAVVVHPIRPAPWGISLIQQKKTLFDALLFKKHPELFRERIGAVPLTYYFTAFALLGAAGSAVGGSLWVYGFGALWAGLTGRFAIRRLTHTSKKPGHILEMIITSCAIPILSIYWKLVGAVRYRVLFIGR